MDRRPTSAIIDTEALKFNYFQLRGRISGNTKVMAVVKANAYGHGDLEVSRIFEALGCECFGVATVEEGARLRSGGIKKPIIVLGGVYAGQIKDIFELDLTPVVFDMDTARLINQFAVKTKSVKDIHVKIDTGMGRLGLLAPEVEPFFREFRGLGGLRLEALLSHFVESEAEDKACSRGQLELFLDTVEAIKAMGFTPRFIDMANSAAAVDYAQAHLDLIRPGIMLYGSYPSKRMKEKVELRPVMSVKTRIMHLKKVPAGFPVSYGRTFTTKRESLIATLPIGYGDGLPRRLSGKGEVLVGGKRAPMVGTICMDMTMCDLTGIGAAVGDEAVVIGAQGAERITAEDIAEKTGTISYEVFCNISNRVPRIYA